MNVVAGLLIGLCSLQLTSFAIAGAAVAGLAVLLAGGRRFALLAGLLAGFAIADRAIEAANEQALDARYAGDSLVATCRILDFAASSGPLRRFPARCEAVVELPRRVRLSWYAPPAEVYPGDTWRLEIRLRRPRGNANPGGFERERADAMAGIGAAGYVVDSRRNALLGSGAGAVTRARLAIVARIDRELGDRSAAAVLKALTVGSRHAMSDRQWTRYAASGTTHLVAISGLHIGLAAAFVAVLMRLVCAGLRVPGNHRLYALGAGAIAATLYALLAGFGLPAQRALIMLLVGVTALAMQRRVAGPLPIAVAAGLVALFAPLSVLSAGFLLSFGAVACLVWLAQRTAAAGRIAGVRLLWTAQLMLFAALLPLSAVVFGRVAPMAAVVNLVAVPLFSLVTVPASLAALPPGPQSGPLLLLAASSIDWLDAFIDRLAVAPLAVVRSPAVLAAAFAAIAWCLLPPGWPGRRLAVVAIPLILWPPHKGPPGGCADVVFLDVGQGTAVVVSTRRHVLLYDTGPAYRTGSAARSVVLPYLAAHGVDALSMLVVSHADLDHAGGLDDLRAGIRIERIVAGETLDGDDWRDCHASMAWVWDDVTFSFLHPQVADRNSGNDASCVLQVSTRGARLLLTGDIERQSEAGLIDRGLAPVDVLSVPHHGSRTSSSPAFVAATRPSYAIVSAGHQNRWNLPAASVQSRWQSSGAQLLNTAEDGAVSLRLCERARIVSRQRRRAVPDWPR